MWWYIYALRELQHEVHFYTTNKVHPIILNNWFSDVPILRYRAGVEKGYDCAITIDHFFFGQPLAQDNMAFVFFPQIDTPPPEQTRLYTVSQYCANHVKHKWGHDAEVMYIPIKGIFKPLKKEKMILHVSRFTEPSEWADKAHRQMLQVFRMYQSDLQDWTFVMAGALDPNMEDYFNELTYRAVHKATMFYMNPTDLEIANLYGRASFYWHATGISLPHIPSAQEHLGLAPLEAQAAGCVPVVLNSGGMPEVVIHGKTGALVDDARQLGQITVQLSRDWSAWSGLSQQGMRWAKRWMDFEAFKTRLIYSLAGMPIPELPDYEIEAPSPKDVTAVIPSMNNVEMLRRCILSMQKTAPDMRILIINNGEPLGSDLFKEGELVHSENVLCHNAGENLGFAGAHRKAEELVDTPLVLLLNDDVEAIHGGWLEFMLYEMARPEVGIVGAKLIYPDGRLQHAGGQLDLNRGDIGHHRFFGEADSPLASQPAEVDFVTGACMLIRKDLYKMPQELVGLLNYEDPWICLLAKEKGFKTVYQPAACLVHYEAQTKVRTPDWESKVVLAKQKFKQRWLS